MGSPDGYEDLVNDQMPALFRRALLLCGDWHLAEDLAQETAIAILTKWRKVSAAEDPTAYVHTMLTNIFLSRARKRSYGEVVGTIDIPHTVDPWPGLDLEIEIAQGLSVLNAPERAVIVSRYLDDQSAAEVAQRMGRKESWVRVTSHRALAKMRSQLDDRACPEDMPTRRKSESSRRTGVLSTNAAMEGVDHGA